MAAFFVSTTKIKNPEKYQEYAGKAGPTFAPFDGKMVLRGKAGDTLVGSSDHQGIGVVRFPDMTALQAWYHSPDYQALIPLREEAADMTLVTYEEIT